MPRPPHNPLAALETKAPDLAALIRAGAITLAAAREVHAARYNGATVAAELLLRHRQSHATDTITGLVSSVIALPDSDVVEFYRKSIAAQLLTGDHFTAAAESLGDVRAALARRGQI